MSDPVLISGGPDAVSIIAAIIQGGTTPAPVPGVNLFQTYRTSAPTDTGFVYLVIPVPNAGDSEFTMGTIVALEHTRVDVILYGNPNDLNNVRKEAMRVRYLVVSKSDYTAGGLRMLKAMPVGGVEYLGRDPNDRSQFMVSFDVTTEPGYQ